MSFFQQNFLSLHVWSHGSLYLWYQEFWVGNEDLVSMYEKRLGDAGYVTYKLARTNNRGDGTLKNFCCLCLT